MDPEIGHVAFGKEINLPWRRFSPNGLRAYGRGNAVGKRIDERYEQTDELKS